MSQTSSCRAELGTAQLSAGNLSYWCWRLLCPFLDLRAHPGTLNDELGFAFMASLYVWLVVPFTLVPFHLPIDIAVFGI